MATMTRSLPGGAWARLNDPLTLTLIAYALAFVCANVAVPSMFRGGWNLYFAQPLVWLALAYWCLKSQRERLPNRGVVMLAMLAAGFQIAVFAIAGLLLGFGESPYARDLLAIGGNVIFLGSSLLAAEMVRAQVLLRFGSLGYGPVLVALGFGLLAVPLAQWQLLAGGDSYPLTFSGQRLMPALAESWLATVLSLLGGPWAALAYRGSVQGTEWLSPVLPSLTWAQTAVVSALAPMAGAWALRQRSEDEAAETAEETRSGVPLWLGASAVVVVALIWLNAGLLGVKPAIVTGISMEPSLYQGDIVVTKGVAPASLRAGDVVRFREGGVAVIHRVKSVSATRQGLVFTTQGDNNVQPDAPVAEAAIEGKVVATIPKLGLLPISVRQLVGR